MRSRSSQHLRRVALLGPALGWWTVLLVVPVVLILAYSVFQRGIYGGVVYHFTWENFRRIADPLYLDVVWFSVRVSLEATVLALLIGYPAAWFIATRPARWRTALLVIVVLPFWTSMLIRTYAWIVLLNHEGVINRTLISAGIVGAPLDLLYNEFAIVLGLLYGYLPLTRTGVAAGCLFVFVPSLGNFIVPDLLGGGRRQMVGNLIQVQFLKARDWPFGATLALAVIVLMAVVLLVQARLSAKDRLEAVDA
jgi:spermidine/putrescine transport system permease protein